MAPKRPPPARGLDPHLASFGRLVGYKLKAWRRDYARLALRIDKRHLNRSGVIHGGVLMTLIDTACGYAGCFDPTGSNPRRAFSLSVTVGFIAAVDRGTLVTVARRTGGGAQTFFATAEIRDGKGRLIAQGEGVYRYRGFPAEGGPRPSAKPGTRAAAAGRR